MGVGESDESVKTEDPQVVCGVVNPLSIGIPLVKGAVKGLSVVNRETVISPSSAADEGKFHRLSLSLRESLLEQNAPA